MAEQVLPDFELPDGRGGTWGVGRLHQGQEILLALLGDEGQAETYDLLRALAREARSVGLAGSAAVALAAGDAAGRRTRELDLPFPVLEDAEGRVQRAIARSVGLRPGEVALLAADRYGAVQFAQSARGRDANQLVRDALDQIEFVQMLCPE